MCIKALQEETPGGPIGGTGSLARNVERNYRGEVSATTFIVLIIIISLDWLFVLLLKTTT